MKTWGMTVIIALVFLGTLFVIFAGQPEQRIAYSEDGLVRLEYVAEAGRFLEFVGTDTRQGVIELNNALTQHQTSLRSVGTGQAGVTPYAYTVSPNDYIFAQPATITFAIDPETAAVDQMHIGYYDQEDQEWKPLATEYDRDSSELSTQIDRVASWALIQYNIDAEN